MPIMRCQLKGKPGFKYGVTGKCYTYKKNDKRSMAAARARARSQGQAIEKSKGNW